LESAIARQVTAFMIGTVGQEGAFKHCLPGATGWLVEVETREGGEGDQEWVSVYELRLDHALNVIGCRRALVRQEARAVPPSPVNTAPADLQPTSTETPPSDLPEVQPPTRREVRAVPPRPLPDRPAPRPPRISYRR
jgi:hypothetical protein